MDVRRLRVLKAVVDAGSITGAAAALDYTPSAISQQVSSLERELGTVLLERAGRGVRPTDAAVLLRDHAERVLAALAEAEEALDALRAGRIGRLRLGAFPTAGAALVPAALAAFEGRHPGVSLDLSVLEIDEALAGLRAGALDVAVVVRSAAGEDDDGLLWRHLLFDPFRLVLPVGHALARRCAVPLAALAGERFIGVTSCPGHCQRVAEEACRRSGFHPTYGLEADEYPTAQGFVAAGLGVALVPLLALGTMHPGVAVRRVKDGDPVREVCAVARQAIAGQAAVASMLECLARSAAALAAA